MLKSLTSFTCAVGIMAFVSSAQAQSTDTVVATVNGTEITLGHVIASFGELPPEYQTLDDNALWEGLLRRLIQETVVGESGKSERSLRVQTEVENAERASRAREALNTVVENAVTEKALQNLYNIEFSDVGDIEYNASHILLNEEELAKTLAERARNGSEFAALAREHSIGPSGPNGGLLGWFVDGTMIPAFTAAVKSLEVGEVSDPLKTEFGWHVIKLNETRIKTAPPLEEVRDDLTERLQSQAAEKRVLELMEEAEITQTLPADIDTSLLRRTDLLDQ